MGRIETAQHLLRNPYLLGKQLGFKQLTTMHNDWMVEMMRVNADDMTLQAHRGSYKTTCLCIVIALMLIRYRDKNVIFMRKTDADVNEVIKQVNRILTSPLMQDIYLALTGSRLVIEKATATEITTSAYCSPRGSAQLLGVGIGGSLTGKHADIIITDDIVNMSDRLSRAEREKTKAIYQELQNIRNRGGRIINTGTPWHKEDAFSIMPAPRKWDCYQTGLIAPEKLDELRRSMSPSLFAANYQLRHIATENALFTDAPRFTDSEYLIYDGIAHIDAAYGGEDFTALTCAKRHGDRVYLYGRIWHAHIDSVLPAVLGEIERLRCAPVYCQNNGDKGYLAREIRQSGAPVRSYHQHMNKYTKISSYLRKWWTRAEWLRGTDNDYLAQIMDYTETAAHDDAPDSAACACRIIDRAYTGLSQGVS